MSKFDSAYSVYPQTQLFELCVKWPRRLSQESFDNFGQYKIHHYCIKRKYYKYVQQGFFARKIFSWTEWVQDSVPCVHIRVVSTCMMYPDRYLLYIYMYQGKIHNILVINIVSFKTIFQIQIRGRTKLGLAFVTGVYFIENNEMVQNFLLKVN